jgi:hypothetical protein
MWASRLNHKTATAQRNSGSRSISPVHPNAELPLGGLRITAFIALNLKILIDAAITTSCSRVSDYAFRPASFLNHLFVKCRVPTSPPQRINRDALNLRPFFYFTALTGFGSHKPVEQRIPSDRLVRKQI